MNRRDAAERIAPRTIRVEASSFCQLRCPSCPTASGAIGPAIGSGFLRLADFRKLLDDNPWLRQVELSNYGEVFLNPDLLAILEYAARKSVFASLGNGVNLNHARPEVLEGLVKYRVRNLTCSIDGASPETYRQYRVRGDFDRVIDNIKRINEFKKSHNSELPRLHWQFVVFGHNEHEIPAAREMACILGMTFRTKLSWDPDFSPVRNKDLVRRQTGSAAVTREEHERIHGQKYLDNICHQLWDAPQINWDGKILGCCRNFWGDFGGNAFASGLAESVNGETMVYARDMLLGKQPARDDIPCTSCELYHWRRDHGQWVTRRKPDMLAAMPHDDAGMQAEAERLRREVLAKQPNDLETIHRLGSIAYRRGQYRRAAEFLGAAVAVERDNALYHFELGQALEALGRPDDAILSYRSALGLDPGRGEAREALAALLARQDRIDESGSAACPPAEQAPK